MILDYATLKVIWWIFIFALFVGFFLFGGRDLGVCILLPLIGKNDLDRRLMINSIGATWEGNQVWFVTAGGAIFAAWPIVYATAFSGLYFAFLLVLITLILRPPGIDFRSKLPYHPWRRMWDASLFLSGIVPALVFGVGLGNVLLGFPFHFDDNMLPHYEGTFFQLLNPFSVLFGLSAVCILALYGSTYLQHKLPNAYTAQCQRSTLLSGILFLILFITLGLWVTKYLNGYQIQSLSDVQSNLIPLTKQVQRSPSWLANYAKFPALWLIPILTIILIIFTLLASMWNKAPIAITLCAFAIVFALLTVNITIFPFILPSSMQFNHSLTVWDSVSSHRTLQYMFWVAIVFLPIVLGYTTWVYSVLKGKIEKEKILSNSSYY